MEKYVFLFGEIGGFGVDTASILKEIAQAKIDKCDTIVVQISSPGGYVYDGRAIYNALKTSGCNIRVEIIGQAFSSASYIAMAGDEILIADKGEMMIHQAWTFAEGNADDLREMADELETMSNEIFNIYVSRGADETKIKPYFDEEKIISASEAIEAGLATGLLEPLKAVARITKSNKSSKMEKTLIEKLLASVNKLMKHTIKNAMITADNGDILYFEGDVVEVGTLVYSDEALETPAADGDYVEGSTTYSVVDGAISNIVEAEVEVEEAPPAETEEVVALKAEIEALKATIAADATAKSELDSELKRIKDVLVTEKVNIVRKGSAVKHETVAEKMKRLEAENQARYKGIK